MGVMRVTMNGGITLCGMYGLSAGGMRRMPFRQGLILSSRRIVVVIVVKGRDISVVIVVIVAVVVAAVAGRGSGFIHARKDFVSFCA